MKFASYIKYTSDTALIAALRAEHRAYLAALYNDGMLIAGGPFADGSGALLVYEAATAEAAAALVAGDPFATGGVFTNIETRPWTLVFSNPEQLRVTP